MQIKKQEDNKLFGRTQVEAEIAFSSSTPSRNEIRKQLAKQFNTDESLVIVKKINTKFGERIATIEANIYKKDKELKSAEPKHIIKRHEEKKKETKEEAPAAPVEAKPEEPVADKKEEVKEEKKEAEEPAKEEKEEPIAEEKPIPKEEVKEEKKEETVEEKPVEEVKEETTKEDTAVEKPVEEEPVTEKK